jgi:cytochrome c oxidase subunit 2
MIENYVEAISTYAGDIDGLFLMITLIVGFWFILSEGVFFYFIFKYRDNGDGKKAQYVTGEEKKQKRPIKWAHNLVLVCDVVLVVFAIKVWVEVKQDLPQADRQVRVIGQQWAWTFQHPGPDGVLEAYPPDPCSDDILTVDELHIEVNKTYHYKLMSKDVLHDFSVPIFRLKQDAVPGREITGWFKAKKIPKGGMADVQCAEMCGIGHGLMAGTIFIRDNKDHESWLKTWVGENPKPKCKSASNDNNSKPDNTEAVANSAVASVNAQ